jgi:microcystin-dependent protein
MDYILGTIVLYAYTFEPYGWYKCDGRTLPISGNEALYSLLGNAYGGAAGSNFNLPNMLGLEPRPYMSFYICNMGVYPSRP